jgi:hypothetical protein
MGISHYPNHFSDRQTFLSWCHIEVTCPNYWFLFVKVPEVSFEMFIPLFLFAKGLRASSVYKSPPQIVWRTLRPSPALTTYVPTI